jgi:glycerophosphoryl diester phosphodiesterase
MAIAHRGASEVAPENTLAAFEEALRLGAPGIECDVRLTNDGIPVILHDETVDRTTTGHGRIAEKSGLDLLRLDAGSWKHPRFAGVRIPTLEEALRAITPAAVAVLELKVPVDAGLLGELIQRFASFDKVLVTSFEPAWLVPLRTHWRELPLGLLADQWTDDLPVRTRQLDAGILILDVELLSLPRVLAAQDLGLAVWCYTANDIGLVAACAAMGVAGVITDRPDLIRHRSRKHGL